MVTLDSVPTKTEVLHRKKFMGGRMSASDAHRALGIRKKCSVCRRPGAIRIKVFMPYDEAMRRAPQLMAAIAASNPAGPNVPTLMFKDGGSEKPFIKASDNAFCDNCKHEARITAATAPSWAVVEIDEGVKDTIQVGYRS
jgi:hypothetical protein